MTARAQGTCLAARDPSVPDENVAKRVVSRRVVLGKASGAPSLAATAERAADGTAEVLVTCTVSTEKLLREQTEATVEGPWQLYTTAAFVGLAGGIGSAAAAVFAGRSSDPAVQRASTVLGFAGAATGLAIAGGGAVLAIGAAPYTTVEERVKSIGLVDAPCTKGTEVKLYAGTWDDQGEVDKKGLVRFLVPSEFTQATATLALSAVGSGSATVEIPPRAKGEVVAHAEREAKARWATSDAQGTRHAEPLAQEHAELASNAAGAARVPTLTVTPERTDDDMAIAVTPDGLELLVSVAQQCARGPCRPCVGASVQFTTWSGAGSTSVQTDGDGKAVLTFSPSAVAASTDGQPWARLVIRTEEMREATFQVEPNAAAYAAALEHAADLRAFEAFSWRFPDHPLWPAALARREAISRDAAAGEEAEAARAAADLENRRAAATAAWKLTKAKTPAALDGVVDKYGLDALTPELVEVREGFHARTGERDGATSYDDGRMVWVILSTHPATVADMTQKGYGKSTKEVATGLAAMACAHVPDLPVRPTYKAVIVLDDKSALVLTGTRARFAQLCKSSGTATDKQARAMASVVGLAMLPMRPKLRDPDLSSRPLQEVRESVACVTSRTPTALTDTQWLMIAPVRILADIDPRTGRERPYARVATQSITTNGDQVEVSLVVVGVLADGTLNVLSARTASRAYAECRNATCAQVDLKSFGRDVGSLSLATTPLRTWPTADGREAPLSHGVCTTVLTASDAQYVPVDAFRALVADMAAQ